MFRIPGIAGAVRIAAVAALLAAVPAQAVVLLGNDFVNWRLFDVDPATGLASNPRPTIVPPSGNTLSDIEYDPSTGVLWGLARIVNLSSITHSLVRINIATGLATAV